MFAILLFLLLLLPLLPLLLSPGLCFCWALNGFGLGFALATVSLA